MPNHSPNPNRTVGISVDPFSQSAKAKGRKGPQKAIPAEVRDSVLRMLWEHCKTVREVARTHKLKQWQVQDIQLEGIRRLRDEDTRAGYKAGYAAAIRRKVQGREAA